MSRAFYVSECCRPVMSGPSARDSDNKSTSAILCPLAVVCANFLTLFPLFYSIFCLLKQPETLWMSMARQSLPYPPFSPVPKTLSNSGDQVLAICFLPARSPPDLPLSPSRVAQLTSGGHALPKCGVPSIECLFCPLSPAVLSEMTRPGLMVALKQQTPSSPCAELFLQHYSPLLIRR